MHFSEACNPAIGETIGCHRGGGLLFGPGWAIMLFFFF